MKIRTKKTLLPLMAAVGMAGAANAQTPAADGYTALPSGIEYKVIKKGDGTRKAGIGDQVEMFIHVYLGDSAIFDSRKMYNATQPVPVKMTAPTRNGDLMEGFMMLAAGDSALLTVPVDTLLKGNAPQMPGMKPSVGQKMVYQVQVVSVRTAEEQKKYDEEMAGKQKGIDEQLLQEYFKKKKLTPTKTESGLYYTITKKGTGANVAAGQMVNVNYTGMLINGQKFDSNTDTAFKHVEPFTLTVGRGQVIKGWDEGLQLLSKGTKATLYIPSALAYGSQDRSPQIPANSILIFDVEIVDITDQASIDEKKIKDHLAKNKIKATRTPSGLYYTISQKGLGPNAAKGKKVTMNYTGRLLDGRAFDSNTDPKFGHVRPFDFTLGIGQVIQGWDEGVQLLQIGTKGTFYIPSALGYGPSGSGQQIPPNSVLVFDVELTGIE
ncbi:FKBP-type peptidyl-prolyl cis-trans isomerase [Nemorincola caseinilytica]